MTECTQCDNEVVDTAALENGSWSIEYLPDGVDFYCAEWDGDRCTVFYHSQE